MSGAQENTTEYQNRSQFNPTSLLREQQMRLQALGFGAEWGDIPPETIEALNSGAGIPSGNFAQNGIGGLIPPVTNPPPKHDILDDDEDYDADEYDDLDNLTDEEDITSEEILQFDQLLMMGDLSKVGEEIVKKSKNGRLNNKDLKEIKTIIQKRKIRIQTQAERARKISNSRKTRPKKSYQPDDRTYDPKNESHRYFGAHFKDNEEFNPFETELGSNFGRPKKSKLPPGSFFLREGPPPSYMGSSKSRIPYHGFGHRNGEVDYLKELYGSRLGKLSSTPQPRQVRSTKKRGLRQRGLNSTSGRKLISIVYE